MLTAGQILKSKPNQTVHSVAPETSVLEAVQTMADKHIGALLVLENGVPAGIITERDFARKFALMNRLPQSLMYWLDIQTRHEEATSCVHPLA